MKKTATAFVMLPCILMLLLFTCRSSKDLKTTTETATEIDTTPNMAWLEKLPNCPCESPDKKGMKLNDGWAKDVGNLKKYHNGATVCFRSYPFIKTSEGYSGQQCCYDAEGKLITEGSGAGTPDKESTCGGEDSEGVMTTRYSGLMNHYSKDVKPWDAFGGVDSGWVQYNQIWIPNNGHNCPNN